MPFKKIPLMFIIGFWSYATSAFAGNNTIACIIEANQIIDIKSPTSGLLESVPYKRGDYVKKGAVIATLESSVEKSSAAVSKYKSTMTGNIESWQAKSDLLGKKFERKRSLSDSQAISVQDRDDAELEKRSADAELKLAKENKELARLEWIQSTEQLNRKILRSPFNGIVVNQYMYSGEVVEPSESKHPILKLAQIDPLRVEIVLPLTMYGSIKAGDSVEIAPEQPIGGNYVAKVRLVDKIVDSASGTFGARLELKNQTLEIPSGVKCSVKLKTK